MKRHLALLVIGCISLTGVFLVSCQESLFVAPVANVADTLSVLYVAPGGHGNGSAEDPLGSIAQAVVMAFESPRIEQIKVATGDYFQSIRIQSSITITGGLDPANGWAPATSGDKTTINGRTIDNLPIAVVIRNLRSPVTLENLTIIGGSISDSGSGSYAVHAIDVDSLTIRDCDIRGGVAMNGALGLYGQNGVAGENGKLRVAGQTPIPGGRGGEGGVNAGVDPHSGSAGENGLCADGSPVGGSGGTGGNISPIPNANGLPGTPGTDGLIGTDGAGASSSYSSAIQNEYLLIFAQSGARGNDGGSGCGGGGGGGSTTFWSATFNYPGFDGGGGGAGATGGEGGYGGQGGGCSVGLVLLNSHANVINSVIGATQAGNGGPGGFGGQGAIGGKGAVTSVQFVLKGGDGGRGGNGAQGGFGGAGSGGWCIGIVSQNSTFTQSSVTFNLGTPGLGGIGQSSGNEGASGGFVETAEIAE